MQVKEFRQKIKPSIKLSIDGKEYFVREVVRFRFDDGGYYIKCFLNDNYVFADDLNENSFLLVREIKTLFQKPFPQELNFDGKEFTFLYTAHAVAEEVWGEEIFKNGDSERFWDYRAKDESYLSLGINDNTREKLDFYGKIIKNNSVKLE
jgi:hypothetical protein